VVYPTKSFTFLGAVWDSSGVERLSSVDETLKEVISSITTNMSPKEKDKVRGYLNYYLAFAGPVHSIINRTFLQPEYGKHYLIKLLECRRIKFRDPPNGQSLRVSSDATTKRLGWIHDYGKGTARLTEEQPIMLTETLATLVGAYSAMMQGSSNITLLTDNMATRAFLRRGAARFLFNFNISIHFHFIFL
jgi:hypothetical protein